MIWRRSREAADKVEAVPPANEPSAIDATDPSDRLDLPPSERCLFIIGAARSGTTVLQNALNDSPDIFLFGEPDFHSDPGAPGFAERYNAMHRSWANQETKSTFCPAVLPVDGAWNDYLRQMGGHHRYIGSKIVINPVRERDALSRLFDFQSRNFYRAKHVFTFRRPLPTVMSTRDLQLLVQGRSDELRVILTNYAETACLYLRMLRNLPHVQAVFHEHVDRNTFDGLERWLDLPLAQAHRYYDTSKVRRYDAMDPSLAYADVLAALDRLYDELRQEAAREFRALQAEQNDNHLSDTHFTAVGRLHRELSAIVRTLAAEG